MPTRIVCYTLNMIVSFKDKETHAVFDGKNNKVAQKRLPVKLWKAVQRKLDQLDSVISLDELRIPPGNRLEALQGDRAGTYSIRINDRYRICFSWSQQGPKEVEIVDYHS